VRIRDRVIYGVVGGIAGTAIGTSIYYIYLRYIAESVQRNSGIPGVSLFAFLGNAWDNETLHMVLSIGTIFNLLVFFMLFWTKLWRAAYGVIYATIGWLVILGGMALLL